MAQSKLETAVNIIGLINSLLPTATQLVLMLKRDDGTFLILDAAEARCDQVVATGEAWLAANPK